MRDLFNFKKRRTPAEAVTFFLFYACLYAGAAWVFSF